MSREDLQRRLWTNGTYVDFDKGLNTAVKKLRHALGDSPDTPVFIETMPRRGYRFIAPVSGNGFRHEELPAGESIPTSATNKKEPADSRSESDSPQIAQPVGTRKFWYVFIAVLFGTAIVLLVRYGRFARPPAPELRYSEITELTDKGRSARWQ